MEQGRIIEKYPAANIVERPDAERPLYQVTKATKSPSYGVLKSLLAVSYTHLRAHET